MARINSMIGRAVQQTLIQSVKALSADGSAAALENSKISSANAASSQLNSQIDSLMQAVDSVRHQQSSDAQLHTRIINSWPQRFPHLQVEDRFILREHQAKDIEQFFEHFSNTQINQHILVTRPRQLAETAHDIQYNQRLYHRRSGIFWSLICRQSGLLMGTVGLYTKHNPVEICYDLAPAYWRQGVMTATLVTVLHYIKQQWSFIKTLRALILKENEASAALLNKLGFVWKKTLPHERAHMGKWYDIEVYELDL